MPKEPKIILKITTLRSPRAKFFKASLRLPMMEGWVDADGFSTFEAVGDTVPMAILNAAQYAVAKLNYLEYHGSH